jgi:short-subunit dehydrogenase
VAASYGANAMAVPIDVTSLESWSRARDAVHARFGKVDILCNNAGVSVAWQPLAETAPETFERTMQINVFGVYNGLRTFVPDMVARGSGHVVNTCSLLGLLAGPSMATYCASKFAVKGMTDALRAELAPQGVGVSALYPGATRSYMTLDESDPKKAEAIRQQSTLMEPIWLGRAVARAIEQNLPHIITHPSSKPAVQAVQDEVLAAFGEPAEPGYRG